MEDSNCKAQSALACMSIPMVIWKYGKQVYTLFTPILSDMWNPVKSPLTCRPSIYIFWLPHVSQGRLCSDFVLKRRMLYVTRIARIEMYATYIECASAIKCTVDLYSDCTTKQNICWDLYIIVSLTRQLFISISHCCKCTIATRLKIDYWGSLMIFHLSPPIARVHICFR